MGLTHSNGRAPAGPSEHGKVAGPRLPGCSQLDLGAAPVPPVSPGTWPVRLPHPSSRNLAQGPQGWGRRMWTVHCQASAPERTVLGRSPHAPTWGGGQMALLGESCSRQQSPWVRGSSAEPRRHLSAQPRDPLSSRSICLQPGKPCPPRGPSTACCCSACSGWTWPWRAPAF